MEALEKVQKRAVKLIPSLKHKSYEERLGILNLPILKFTGWAKKIGPFLNVDNFAMISGRKECYMSKACKFCMEKSIKLA